MGEERCLKCMETYPKGTEACPHCGYDQKSEQSPFGMKPGSILWGRYLVGTLLGQGGFGMTYIGFDLKLESKVAIKEYFPAGIATRNSTVSNQIKWNSTSLNAAQWQNGCESFLKEARRMEKMNASANVVRVRDTFKTNDTAYIVMDFIEGETLKQKLVKSGPMSFEACMALLRPLMESLIKMHQKDLIHRDISPDNIMVREDGSACLLDFGAAKDISFQQNAASQQVTKKGFSPFEQYQEGGKIGPWTDVYALCATIYYCVTGKLIPDSMDRVYNDTLVLDPSFTNAVSPSAAEAVAAGLKVRQEDRIQTVAELIERLEGKAAPIQPDPPARPQNAQSKNIQPQSMQESSVTHGENPANQGGIVSTPDTVSKKGGKKKAKIIGGVAAAVAAIGIISSLGGDDSPKTSTNSIITSQTEEAESTNEESSVAKESETDYNPNAPKTSAVYVMAADAYEGPEPENFPDNEKIAAVSFVGTLENAPAAGSYDFSANQDKSVLVWWETNEAGEAEVFFGSNGRIQLKDGRSYSFEGLTNCRSIHFNGCFDTSNVTDMSYMFSECSSLTELDLSGFDTGNVTDMFCMFDGCNNLTELDLSGFDTGNVTNMSWMFDGCSQLEELDLSGFDTGNVTNMNGMFSECSSLSELDLSGFDTGNVTYMEYMFSGCDSLSNLDLSHFNMYNVKNINEMFLDSNLTIENTGLEVKDYSAAVYLQCMLDFYLKGNISEVVTRGIATEEEAETAYNEFIGAMSQSLGIDGITDEQNMKLTQALVKTFAGAKYTIGKAGEQTDGKYEIPVSVQKMNVFGPTINDKFMEAVENKSTELAALGEEERNAAIIDILIECLEEAADNAKYDKAVDSTVTVTVQEGKYDINENELYTFFEALYDLDALENE